MYNGQMKFHSEGIRGYAVTEQPGDMTKYTHIIIPYSSSKLFVVSADPLGGGASIRFNSSVYVQYSLVRDIMETFNTMDDVHDHAAFMNNYFGFFLEDENVFTKASVIRCCAKLMEE
jgi:hypothetical protein